MGAVGREALDQPMAHGVVGLEADAAALGPAQLRHVPFKGDYQVLGVHAAPRSTRLTIWRREDRCVSILV